MSGVGSGKQPEKEETEAHHKADAEQNRSDDSKNLSSVGAATVLGGPAAGVNSLKLLVTHNPRDGTKDLTNDQSEYPENEDGSGLTLLRIGAAVLRKLFVCHIGEYPTSEDAGASGISLIG